MIAVMYGDGGGSSTYGHPANPSWRLAWIASDVTPNNQAVFASGLVPMTTAAVASESSNTANGHAASIAGGRYAIEASRAHP